MCIKNKLNYIFCLLLWGALTSCSSTPPQIKYYALDPLNFNKADLSNKLIEKKQKYLMLESVELAEYLHHQGLVLQTNENQYYLSTNHLWAENLATAISRNMLSHLETKLPQLRVESQSIGDLTIPDYRLKIEFSHFHPNHLNQVVTAGHFWILNKDSQLISKETFLIQESLDKNGYLHAVEKLSQSTEKLADKISKKLLN